MTPADQLLLTAIRTGDEPAWTQLVRRYQGRLLAFATKQTRNPADAEDAVQDAFVSFLKQLVNYRGDASIETYLFQILRHRIIDQHRKQVRRPCRLGSELSAVHDATAAWSDAGPSPSAHAGQREAQSHHHVDLAAALRTVTERYQTERDFDKLRVIELLFYAQLAPAAVAEHTGVKPNTIATIKRRTLQRVGAALTGSPDDNAHELDPDDAPLADTLLTTAWETARPSCPKRSTVGAYLLGSLDPDWHAYVAFHLNTLGCRFCVANHDDLQQQTAAAASNRHVDDLNARILRSSVGFLKRDA